MNEPKVNPLDGFELFVKKRVRRFNDGFFTLAETRGGILDEAIDVLAKCPDGTERIGQIIRSIPLLILEAMAELCTGLPDEFGRWYWPPGGVLADPPSRREPYVTDLQPELKKAIEAVKELIQTRLREEKVSGPFFK